MNDTYVTFHGWAGSEVRHREVGDTDVATVRVGVTPRLRKDGEWVDGETTWYSVTAWRTLADHLRDSVRKGDPLIVHGRLRTESWQAEGGGTNTTLQVDASLIGHDLNRGITHFIRRRTEQPSPEVDQTGAAETGAAETTHATGVGGASSLDPVGSEVAA